MEVGGGGKMLAQKFKMQRARASRRGVQEDYRGLNSHQQIGVLQNQWRLNGGKDLNDTYAQDLVTRSPEAKSLQWSSFFMRFYGAQNVFFFSEIPHR